MNQKGVAVHDFRSFRRILFHNSAEIFFLRVQSVKCGCKHYSIRNLHLNEKRKGFWSQFWSCELALATEFHIEDVPTCKERGRKKLVEKARFGETSYEKGLLDSSGDPQDFFAIEAVLTLTLPSRTIKVKIFLRSSRAHSHFQVWIFVQRATPSMPPKKFTCRALHFVEHRRWR